MGALVFEGSKFEAEGRERGRNSWGGAASPLPTSYGLGSELPQQGSGWSPDRKKCIFERIIQPNTRLVAFCPVNLGFLGDSALNALWLRLRFL